MKTSQRVRWASALLVSRALQRRGIELPSMRTLLQTTEDNDYVPSFSVGEERETPSSEILSASATKDGIPQSSMFEFVGAAQKPKLPAPHESASEEMSSSIFDSFYAEERASRHQFSFFVQTFLSFFFYYNGSTTIIERGFV